MTVADPEGIELDSSEAAQDEAVRGAEGLVAEAVGRGERDYRGAINVQDVYGNPLLTLTFACVTTIDAVPFS